MAAFTQLFQFTLLFPSPFPFNAESWSFLLIAWGLSCLKQRAIPRADEREFQIRATSMINGLERQSYCTKTAFIPWIQYIRMTKHELNDEKGIFIIFPVNIWRV